MIRFVAFVVVSVALFISFQSVKPKLRPEDILQEQCIPSQFYPTAIPERTPSLTDVVTPTPPAYYPTPTTWNPYGDMQQNMPWMNSNQP